MNKMTVRDIDVSAKRVLVRVDYNVPLDGNTVTDDTRIRASVPTLKYLLGQNPKAIILMSHLGRPKGKHQPEFSLKPIVPLLSEQLGIDVQFSDDCVGESAENAIANLPEGGVLLLENTRYHAGETSNDPKLASQLAQHGDIFVNDAFGTAHRAHASNVGVSEHLTAVSGLLLEKEIDYLATTLESPKTPFIAILGGAKVSDKIGVIEALLAKVDSLLIGGGMANTFFKAQGREMGDSLVEADAIETAKSLLVRGGNKIILPVDSVIANKFDNNANHKTIPANEDIPSGWQALDIGEASIALFKETLKGANTVIWNGPMGVFEMSNFAKGTFAVAQALADATANGAITIIGGGDSAAAAEDSGLADQITHISTGGGASLELLEGKALPGLVALQDK